MNEQKIGLFIKQLRTEKKYTQKELAEQLNITDKAISKWECGLNCPDISLIAPLAKLLECSASELLNGQRTDEPFSENIEHTISEALIYSDRNTQNRLEKIKYYMLIVLTASFVLAAVICFICDFCITGKFSWSLTVLVSLLFCWSLLVPLLKSTKNSVRNTLLAMSLAIVPYLLLLGNILNESLVYTLGTVISVISVIFLWGIYIAFNKMHHRKTGAAGVVFLLAIPVSLSINRVVSWFVPDTAVSGASDFINVTAMAVTAMICFGVDYVLSCRGAGE